MAAMLDRVHGRQVVTPLPATAPPPPTGWPLPVRVAHEVDQLTDELLTALQKYRTAKRVYAARVAVFEAKFGPTAEADIAAKTDYRRARAISDCNWWRGEVMAASNALIAMRNLGGAPDRGVAPRRATDARGWPVWQHACGASESFEAAPKVCCDEPGGWRALYTAATGGERP